MTKLRVLIAGAGVTGEALAFWLSRGGHHVVVAERSPELRAYGAQVDLRGQGIDAAKAMGLLDRIAEHLVDEPGVAFVDRNGRTRGTIMANTSGTGRQTLTSEYEIMRGDLVQLLHDANGEGVDYRFGVGVDGFDQDERGVTARFSDGSAEDFDLLVGADGQGSRLRRAVVPDDRDPYRHIGIHMAYWFVPRIASDGRIRDTYLAPRGRQIMRRSHNATETQAYFVQRDSSPDFSAIHRRPTADQQAFWADRFRDAGWQAQRFIDGMPDSPFFYSQEVVQVRIDRWSRGRVVLAGDAAHCASPYSGMGISGGLVGAYVLAGQLNRRADDLPTALANYETELRPFVDEIQGTVNPRILNLAMPAKQVGIDLLLGVTGLATALRIPELVARFATEDRGGGWRLPPSPVPPRG
ncbi:FAD-dependent monooxygenase [Cryptosporangium arvum]|uniref:FAD-dependent monooxygenase n=1 Tax=Cryptosporangium arvum TaxID=80871 RepID=UPI0004BCB9B7|nr:FAD-dependent monooxygenase [Cryptosporangium arvum]